MGITNIGFSRYPADSSSLSESIDSHPKHNFLNGGDETIYIKFRTLYDNHKNIWFETSMTGYERAGLDPVAHVFTNGDEEIFGIMVRYDGTDQPNVTRRYISATDPCDFVGYQWSIPLFNNTYIKKIISGVDNLTIQTTQPNPKSFSTREWDVFFFNTIMAARMDDDTRWESDRTALKLEYSPPDVSVTSATYMLTNQSSSTDSQVPVYDEDNYRIRITYYVPYWERHTDRFGLEEFKITDGRDLVMTNGWGQVLGNDNGNISLDLPITWFRTILSSDEVLDSEGLPRIYLDFKIRVNANYNPNEETTYWVNGEKIPLTGYSSFSKWENIVYEVQENGISLKITATEVPLEDSSEYQNLTSDRVYLSLVDAILPIDTVEMTKVEGNTWEGVLSSPPLGEFDIIIRGWNSSIYAVSTGTSTIPPRLSWPTELTIVPIDTPEEAVSVIYNRDISWTTTPEQESNKFLGRERDTVWTGTGGSMTASLKGTFYEYDDAVSILNPIYKQKETKFLNLPFQGACVLTDPYGPRKKVVVNSVNVTRSDEVLGLKDVSMSITEVT